MAITIIQDFESTILSANNPNYLILDGVDTFLDVTIMINSQTTIVANSRYASINGFVHINVEDFVKSAFSSKHKDTFNYTANESYTSIDGNHIASFDITAIDNSATVFDKNGTVVINASLQIGQQVVMNDFINNILSENSVKLPYFSGYPKSVTKLTATTLERINVNSLDTNSSEEIDLCGVYVKWLNLYGGYSYWLFDEPFTEITKAKSLKTIKTNWTNRIDAISSDESLGFIKTKEKQIVSKIPSRYIKEIESLFTSKEVYLYISDRFSTSHKWLKVNTKSSLKYKNTREFTKIKLSLMLPNQYTQRGI